MLRVLALWGGFASLNSMLSNYLYAVNRQRAVVLQSVVALSVNVCLNVTLILLLGGLGVAISITAAEFVGTMLLLSAQRKTAARATLKRLAGYCLKCLVAAGVAVPVAWQIARVHVIAAVAGGLCLYFLLLALLRGFDKADTVMLRRILGRD